MDIPSHPANGWEEHGRERKGMRRDRNGRGKGQE